jgi:hypothetical protein
MMTMLRRMFWLALLGGAGYAGWTAWQGRSQDDPPTAPEWPPLEPPLNPAASDRSANDLAATDRSATDEHQSTNPANPAETTEATWVEPVTGACPDGYPIKANNNSGIFHVPGGRFYERTVPERCYADAADAEADGYRRAKA